MVAHINIYIYIYRIKDIQSKKKVDFDSSPPTALPKTAISVSDRPRYPTYPLFLFLFFLLPNPTVHLRLKTKTKTKNKTAIVTTLEEIILHINYRIEPSKKKSSYLSVFVFFLGFDRNEGRRWAYSNNDSEERNLGFEFLR